ncbi:MAG: 2-amino-4-hydroxy-6-hydroxymethyldihydropteridine diphosphokinase [Steroidobacteraceae bacterium]
MPAYVGVGSNVGEPEGQVRAALAALAALPATRLVATSPLYRTLPFGPVAQDDFINAVAGLLTRLPAQDLFAALRAIETAQGRVRTERWGPRTLDLDLLVYGSQRIDSAELSVPHPGIAARGFVLRPLADIAPELQVPGVGRVADLLARLPGDGIVARVAA